MEGCLQLTNISIPCSVQTIESNAFLGVEILTINGDIQSIPDNSFTNCTSLNKIRFNTNSLKSIGISAFENCSSLSEISIGSSIEIVNSNAFLGIKKLIIKGEIPKIPDNTVDSKKSQI